MRRIVAGVMCLLALCHYTCAQTSASGQVIDVLTKEPLVGVTVRLAHAGTGTVTGTDGSFMLSAAAAADTLLFTYTGYQALRLALQPGPGLVQLQPASNQLNQVLVS